MEIVVSNFMDEDTLKNFGNDVTVRYESGLVDDRAELFCSLSNADAIVVRNRTQVNSELLAAGPRLKVIGRVGVGLDNIDVTECKARGIAVCPATGANPCP